MKKRTFSVANKTGGLSGSAIKPAALRMVWQACRAVSIPVIGMGGIQSAEDALEFIMAGAAAVAVGTANFRNPCAMPEIIEGLEKYMEENGIRNLQYFGSQPWGFSSSMIAGCTARLYGPDEIRFDRKELAAAEWHLRSRLLDELTDISIAHEMIESLRL